MKYSPLLRRVSVMLVLAISVISPLAAQKAPVAAPFETPAPPAVVSIYRDNMRLDAATGIPLSVYAPGYRAAPGEPETQAREYLAAKADFFGWSAEELSRLRLHAVRKSPAATVVRFRQYYRDMPVGRGEVTISLQPDGQVSLVQNAYAYVTMPTQTQPTILPAAAQQIAVAAIGAVEPLSYAAQQLVIWPGEAAGITAYEHILKTPERSGEWQVIIDASDGSILQLRDIAAYAHPKKTAVAVLTPVLVSGTGRVFNPDPLSTAGATYGVNGYIDDNDADVPVLIAEQKVVTLPEITLDGGLYSLKSPYAEVVDHETPFRGLFMQASPNFLANRSAPEFEAVNVFYHLDASMRYLNDTINVTVVPSQHGGRVQFDPSGLNNDDNSHYTSSDQRLAFGDGGVDDAEDSDVIHHELGHGLHDWITSGGLSQNEGLSEGSGDYWAASYNRFLGYWNSAEDAYDHVFTWDGHNEYWSGRRVDINGTYPGWLSGGIHNQGQFWSSSMMLVWDAIGREATDRIFWEGLAMTNGGSNQNDAAVAAYQAALALNYDNAQRSAIHSILSARGYVLPALVLPVDWLEFTVRNEAERVFVTWRTAMEVNNEEFVVLRSAGDGAPFVEIGRTAGAGTTSDEREYRFIDMAPLSGTSYYRLCQVDFDGTTAESPVRSVVRSEPITWQVSPNPARAQLWLTNFEDYVQIELLDQRGILLERFTTGTEKRYSITTTSLPVGVYFIRINGEVKRFIKQ